MGSVKLISFKLTGLVSFEQSQLKPFGRSGGGLLKSALGGKWGSSLPLEQRARTPWKILGQGLVPLKFFDFHFIWKDEKLDYFGGRSRRVYHFFHFSVFYANFTNIFFLISIIYVEIKKFTIPSAMTSKLVQFFILSYKMKIEEF